MESILQLFFVWITNILQTHHILIYHFDLPHDQGFQRNGKKRVAKICCLTKNMHCNLQKKDTNFVEEKKFKFREKKLRIFCKHKCDYSVKNCANIAHKILLCKIC